MNKVTLWVYYGLAVIAVVLFGLAWLDVADAAECARKIACACFVLLLSLWTWADAQVKLK